MILRQLLDCKPVFGAATSHDSSQAFAARCSLRGQPDWSTHGRTWRRPTYPRDIAQSQEFPRPSKPEDAYPQPELEEETEIHDLLTWLVQNGETTHSPQTAWTHQVSV